MARQLYDGKRFDGTSPYKRLEKLIDSELGVELVTHQKLWDRHDNYTGSVYVLHFAKQGVTVLGEESDYRNSLPSDSKYKESAIAKIKLFGTEKQMGEVEKIVVAALKRK